MWVGGGREVLCAVALAMFVSGCSGQLRTTIGIEQAQIQKRVSDRFPVEKDLRILEVSLSDPEITLESDSDRIGFSMKANARVGREHLDGRLKVDGRLYFDPDSKTFYLRDARVLELDMPGLDEKYQPTLIEVSTVVIATAFAAIPLHELSSSSLANAFVHDVRIERGTVWVSMGL